MIREIVKMKCFHRCGLQITLSIALSLGFVVRCAIAGPGERPPAIPAGNATIRRRAGNSDIVIRTTARLAGAISSLTWNGREFVDRFDHGREIQSAANFDFGTPLTGETFNPTEAGSRDDGRGDRSTSRLLHMVVAPHSLQTTTQMAFWLRPGETSSGRPAKNRTILSNHLVTKRVTIGYKNLPQVVQYSVTFHVPIGERHTAAVFEAVTGYMPSTFEKFWKFDTATGTLHALSDGPGEQSQPVVLSTRDGRYAMGVYSPDQPSKGYKRSGYGRFRFAAQKVTKWNCVFRVRNRQQGVAAGEYSFRVFIAVGDLHTVTTSLKALHREFTHR